MDSSQLDQLLSDQWRAAVNACCNPSKWEPDDLRQIRTFNSWDNLQRQLTKAKEDDGIHQDVAMLAHGLLKLKSFTDAWVSKVSVSIDASILWGMNRLILKLVCEETYAAPHVLQALRENCGKIEVLDKSFMKAANFTAELKEACIEALLTLLRFLTAVINFMRNDMTPVLNRRASNADWQLLEAHQATASRSFDEVQSRVEKLSRFLGPSSQPSASHSTRDSDSISSWVRHSSFSDEQAKLPCVILPSIRTSRFFDRIDIVENMERYFEHSGPDQTFQSLTLHGLGGVGKSTVALRYAENKLRRGELDALFWVHSQKLVSIRQSFTDIALRLKLPDARQGDHDENIALVLSWLQHTQCRWLLVYDNAEVADLIRAHWPVASRGQALITTRNPSIAFELTDDMMEITAWDKQTGLQFLLHLITRDMSVEEVSSAEELSEKLSGHALAISAMAGLIDRRQQSVTDFMHFYNQYPSRIHGISGNRSINTLWDMSFHSLDPESATLLGVLSFADPESIPQALFEPNSFEALPETLRFLEDPFLFEGAIDSLLTLALIKRDPTSRTFSLHRLVQAAFKSFLGPEKRQQSFNEASLLIWKAFPSREANPLSADLFKFWDECAKYLPHVISLKDFFREEKRQNPRFRGLQSYCNLNNSCQRYLLELNEIDVLQDLIDVNMTAMQSMPESEQANWLQGSLTSHRGQVYMRTGHTEQGVQWLRTSYDIRCRDMQEKPLECAWAADNLALAIGSSNDFTDALHWCDVARNHFLVGTKEPLDSQDWDATLMMTTATNLFHSGDSQRASELLHGALNYMKVHDDEDWYMASVIRSQLGLIDRRNGSYDSAEVNFMEAQNLYSKTEGMRSHPLNGANLYHLGCVALDQFKVEAAIKHFRDAMNVTQMRRHNMVAEHMRVLFKLSEALEQDPRSANEAAALRQEAEDLLQRRAPRSGSPGLEVTYDNLVMLEWR